MTSKSIFGQIWAQKVKVVRFAWKLVHMVSQRCWFLFQHEFSQFSTLNSFLGKFGSRNSKLLVLCKNWHNVENTDSYSDISFLNFQPKILFWSNLGQKSQICLFCMKIGTHGISRMQILILRSVFWISKPKSIFVQSHLVISRVLIRFIWNL